MKCCRYDMGLLLAFVAAPKPVLASPCSSSLSPICTSQSRPNPIANQYPNLGTGTANGTIAIIPINYSMARSIIPSQYPILTHAYQSLMPSLPKDKYPMYLDIALDHDLQEGSLTVPDFTRASLVYPFVDRLNDGHTSFRYGAPVLITNNSVVYAGSIVSQETFIGTFDPPCDGYASVPRAVPSSTYIKGWNSTNQALGFAPSFDAEFHHSEGDSGFGINVYKNITNQVLFGTGVSTLCDHFQQLFNSSVSMGKYAPRYVTGTLKIQPPYYPYPTTFNHIQGIQLDAAFIETPGQNCSQFSGYNSTGSGD